ncbi:MAG: dihydroneopterin aldolase [Candidatus Wolframiiraptor sp. EX4484-121]|nr:MAG: dihydroneopterin aldolase [Candidatus Wolframiiraptor sp. EX4484-121]
MSRLGRHPESVLKLFAEMSDKEHAVFEAGICLASILHQLIGLPVKADEGFLEDLAEVAQRSFSLQPFRADVRIKILKDRLKISKTYGYGVISPESLDVRVEVRYGEARAVARLRYVEELDYPLMYVEEVNP